MQGVNEMSLETVVHFKCGLRRFTLCDSNLLYEGRAKCRLRFENAAFNSHHVMIVYILTLRQAAHMKRNKRNFSEAAYAPHINSLRGVHLLVPPS